MTSLKVLLLEWISKNAEVKGELCFCKRCGGKIMVWHQSRFIGCAGCFRDHHPAAKRSCRIDSADVIFKERAGILAGNLAELDVSFLQAGSGKIIGTHFRALMTTVFLQFFSKPLLHIHLKNESEDDLTF